MVLIGNIIQFFTCNTLKIGANTLWNVCNSQGIYGCVSNCIPQITEVNRLIRRPKDWACAEFPFLSFSHKLEMNVRKEIAMSTIAFAVILLIRAILPITVLIALGEWVRRREAHYWLPK